MEGTEYNRRARHLRQIAAVMLCVFTAALATGCGGQPRQDKDAPTGNWEVTVLDWQFAEKQPLGEPQDFVLKVRNSDTRAIPQLIVTIGGLRETVYQPGAATDVRPIWMLKEPDYANVTPYNAKLSQSFNLGKLEPGETATYTVNLTPLRRGRHEVTYRLSPALFGENKVVNASDGSLAADTREVVIDPTPVFDDDFFED